MTTLLRAKVQIDDSEILGKQNTCFEYWKQYYKIWCLHLNSPFVCWGAD